MKRKEIEKIYIIKINSLRKNNEAYFSHDKPLISDSEYDSLKIEILNLEKRYSYLKNALQDLEKQDYRLKADSPLRGKAINLSDLYKPDFYGRPLPKTGNWDIGAIQYNATKPTKALQPNRLRSHP